MGLIGGRRGLSGPGLSRARNRRSRGAGPVCRWGRPLKGGTCWKGRGCWEGRGRARGAGPVGRGGVFWGRLLLEGRGLYGGGAGLASLSSCPCRSHGRGQQRVADEDPQHQVASAAQLPRGAEPARASPAHLRLDPGGGARVAGSQGLQLPVSAGASAGGRQAQAGDRGGTGRAARLPACTLMPAPRVPAGRWSSWAS